MLEDLRNILESEGLFPSQKIYNNIQNGIDVNARHIHISFLIDIKKLKIITYSFNVYYRTNTFPYSIHSEINTIVKFYKMQNNKTLTKCKKKLIVIKLTKNGVIGMSKPCQACANFIINNKDNINLTEVKFSTRINKLETIKCNDIHNYKFKTSSAFKKYLKKN